MGVINDLPCLCTRNKQKVKSIIVTNKFMKVDKNIKMKIFSYLEYNKELFKAIAFNKRLRKELKFCENFSLDLFHIFKKLNEKFKSNYNCEGFNSKMNYLFDYLNRNYKLDDLIYFIAIYFLNKNYNKNNFNKDKLIKSNIELLIDIQDTSDDKFLNFFENLIKTYIKISTTLFTFKNYFKFGIYIYSERKNFTKKIFEYFKENEIKVEIDLFIPEKYCCSSLSSISISDTEFKLEKLTIEKISLYEYGINIIEKKFKSNGGGLKFLEIKETKSEAQDEESEIYDVINANLLKELILINKSSLTEITFDTGKFINILSDEFYSSILDCQIINKLEIKSKISKINLEIFKQILNRKHKYFDIQLSLVTKDDFIEHILFKNLIDYIINEKIILFPFCENLLILPEIKKINILSYIFEEEPEQLCLNFNPIFMEIYESLLIYKTDYIIEIADFISFNYIKRIKVIHNKKYCQHIKNVLNDLFIEIKKRQLNDFQIEEFYFQYEGESIEIIFDVFYDYFLTSPYIKILIIEKIVPLVEKENYMNNSQNQKMNENSIKDSEIFFSTNEIKVIPYFKFQFSSYNSTKWIKLIYNILKNNRSNDYACYFDLYFHISNETFSNNFSNFINQISDIYSNHSFIINKFYLDFENTNKYGEKNFDKLINFISNLELLPSFTFIHKGEGHNAIKSINGMNSMKDGVPYLSENIKNQICNLFSNLKNLKKLQFKDSRITINMVQAILENLKVFSISPLSTFDFSGIVLPDNIIDHYFQNLFSDKRLSHIKKLKIKINNFLTSQNSFEKLDELLKKLKYLEIFKIYTKNFNEKNMNLIMNKYKQIHIILQKY